MKTSIEKMVHGAVAAGVAVSLAWVQAASAAPGVAAKIPADVAASLRAIPDAELVQTTKDGIPTLLRGDLGHLPQAPADDAALDRTLRARIGSALASFRLASSDLALRKVSSDAGDSRHFRYRQMHDGLEVVGGDLVVHVDRKGTIYAVNGTARGDLASTLGSRDIGERAAADFLRADPDHAGMKAGDSRAVYLITADGSRYKAWEFTVTGARGQDPVRDKVYVDADSGRIVAVYPQVYFAESRKVYSANNGSSLPGALRRSEGQAATGDLDIDAAYDNTGSTWEAYRGFWNRDSFDNAGATLISSVHYSTNYCNAYWDSTQMVYGDGDASQACYPLARAVDVTGHELTHAVTEKESGLVYSGEPGGLNEAMSDIFGAFVEAWVDGGKTGALAVSGDTWLVGEDVLPPALRWMNDPAKDGASADFWTSTVGNKDVHYSSGVANLAFYLLSQGGTHPRGKSTVQVTGVGMEKAIRIFYKANVDILTSNAKFLAAANATVQAAQDLGYPVADQVSVANAWQAVGVAVGTPGGGGTGGDTVLSNGVAVAGLSDVSAGQKFFSLVVPAGQTSLSFKLTGGSGDPDLYVRNGSHPTTSVFDCRPYLNGSNETCTFTNPAAGTWYVMVRGYTAYSGASLTGTYTGPVADDVPTLTSGQAVGVSGASASQQFWKVVTPAGKKLVVSMSGGTGDADLYMRFGSKPTTSTYSCRPYLTGNNESCTVTSTQAGTYYVMVRGYTSFSGLTLKATY